MFDVVSVPGSELPTGHEWLLVSENGRQTAFVAERADYRALAEMVEAIRRRAGIAATCNN